MLRDIDRLIEALRIQFPDLMVRQLEPTLPNDDDGVWWLWLPNTDDSVQVYSPDGNCPLLVTCGERLPPNLYSIEVESVDRAVDVIKGALSAHLSHCLKNRSNRVEKS